MSGTADECKAFWQVYVDTFQGGMRPPLWSIPGNHEYIDAGEGYFIELINKKLLGGGHQSRSYFCLESKALQLQILALDTGYNSSNFTLPLGSEKMDYTTYLDDAQAEWAQERLLSAKNDNLRTIVLTHHQYFSAFWSKQAYNSTLGRQILGPGQPITAWIWGHEHRVSVYQDPQGLVRR